MDVATDYSQFFIKPDDTVAKNLASRVEQWKLVEFEKTPAGCPIPKEGEAWDPVIGAGPFRPYMVPKGVAVADGVLVMIRLYCKLPYNISDIAQVDLQKIHGFTRKGRIQRQLAKTPRDSGSIVYDVDGNLMTIDETVMRGSNVSDATRLPGRVNETNFLNQQGPDKNLWFNRLFNGVDTQFPGIGAAFAHHWLTTYGCDSPKDSEGLDPNVRSTGETKQERYKQYYSSALARREKGTKSTSSAKQKKPPNLTIRLNLKTAQKPNPNPLKAPAILMEPYEGNDREKSESELSSSPSSPSSSEETPLAPKLAKPIPRPEASAGANNSVAAALGEPNGDKNIKESNEEMAPAPTKTIARLEVQKALNMLETPAVAPINNVMSAPAETSAERAARVKNELAARTKEVEDMTRELKEIEEKAAAEKAAAEEAAARKAAARKAAAEKVAVEREAAEKAAAKTG